MTNPTTITAPEYLPYIDVERTFDASVAQVYRVSTDPELVAKWIGPRWIETEVLEYDVRTGGSYCYRQTVPDAGAFVFRGVYHSVVPEVSTIATFEFDGAPGQATLEFTSYEERGGRAIQRTHSVFPSVEARDAALASGMEEGIRDSYDRIEELVAARG